MPSSANFLRPAKPPTILTEEWNWTQGLLCMIIFALLAWTYYHIRLKLSYAQFPLVSLDGLSPRESWLYHATDTVAKGTSIHAAFQVATHNGPKLVLANCFADDVKNHSSFSFSEVVADEFFSGYPGFEPFSSGGTHDSTAISNVIRKNLTPYLSAMTETLASEALSSIKELFGEGHEWQSVPAKDNIHTLIACLSSRAFLGKNLCHHQRWLQICKAYTTESFLAAQALRGLPSPFRPIAHRFLKHSTAIRRLYREAQDIILPEVRRRQKASFAASEAEDNGSEDLTSTKWMCDRGKQQPLDHVATAMGITLAAVHTTTEAILSALADLCAFPSLQRQLREEMNEVLGNTGWSRGSLFKMKLLDSFLKESQRFHPSSAGKPLGIAKPGFSDQSHNGTVLTQSATVALNRRTLRQVTLSNGTVLPKSATIMVAGRYFDSSIYKDPTTFCATRFLQSENTSGANAGSFQHVSTSPHHLGFGLGRHACPGRFLASDIMKITLSILLLKYDWSFEQGQTLDSLFISLEASNSTKPAVHLCVRRRDEEIRLENLFKR